MARRSDTAAPDARAEKVEKGLLFVVVFLCGAALMAMEIAGSRVIAPFFGSSIFTWGSLIGIFMAALAVGYFVGGKMADRYPSLALLGAIVAFSGLFAGLIAWFGMTICRGIYRTQSIGVIGGPLLASVALFFVPSTLLGMVSPYSVRLLARDLKVLGNVAGRLYALSTTGSIVGTLFTAFFLLPLIGTRTIIWSIAIVLMLLGLLVVLMVRRIHKREGEPAGRGVKAASAVILLLALLVGYGSYPVGAGVMLNPKGRFWVEEITYYEDSAYHLIVLTEQDVRREGRYRRRRLLHFNDRIESAVYVPVRHYRIDVAADGRLATADNNGIISVRKDGQVLYTLDGHKGAEVTVLAFSPDGKYLLSGGTGGLLRVWDGEKIHKTLVEKRENNAITCAAWSPKGDKVVAGYFKGALSLHELDGDTRLDRPSRSEIYAIANGINPSEVYANADAINAVAFRPDGRAFAAAYREGDVVIHSLDKGSGSDPALRPGMTVKTLPETGWFSRGELRIPAPIHTHGNPAPAVWTLAYGADGANGKILVTGGDGGLIRKWDAGTGSHIEDLDVGDRRVYHVAFAGADLVAAAGCSVYRFRNATGAYEKVHAGSAAPWTQTPIVSSIAAGPDGGLFVALADRTVWKAAGGKVEKIVESAAIAFESAVDYTKLLHLGLIFKDDPQSVLVVGGGGGIAPREFSEHYGVRSVVAEIDKRVEEISRRPDIGFGLDLLPDDAIRFHIGDARRTLDRLADSRYDYIILDAYSSGGQIPFHLMTQEFLELCRKRLTPDGVVVSNVISGLVKKSRLYRAEYRTFYAAGFKHVYMFYKRYNDLAMVSEQHNIILVATQDERKLNADEIFSRAQALVKRAEHPVKVRRFVEFASSYQMPVEDYEQYLRLSGENPIELPPYEEKALRKYWESVPILTDDFAPVDNMYDD